MYPAFAHFRRTATRDVEMHGKTIREGDKVLLWYVSSNRDEDVYEDPQRLDVTRRPDHQAFGAGRPALLPRRRAGAARDQDAAHRDAASLPRHRARRRADQGTLAVPEPAEDAAGPAHAGSRGGLAAGVRSPLEALEVALLERAVDEPGLDVLLPARAAGAVVGIEVSKRSPAITT